MPQTEPMTPEVFAYDLACSMSGCFEQIEETGCRFSIEKARGIIKGYIAQRDRAILEAAADSGKIIPIEMLREAGNAGFASSHYDETVTDEEYATIAKRFGYILAPLEKGEA